MSAARAAVAGASVNVNSSAAIPARARFVLAGVAAVALVVAVVLFRAITEW